MFSKIKKYVIGFFVLCGGILFAFLSGKSAGRKDEKVKGLKKQSKKVSDILKEKKKSQKQTKKSLQKKKKGSLIKEFVGDLLSFHVVDLVNGKLPCSNINILKLLDQAVPDNSWRRDHKLK